MNNTLLKGIDIPILFLYLTIAFFGVANIYSVHEPSGVKQLTWLSISIIIGLSFFLFRAKFFENFAGVFCILGIILLVGVLFLGKEINGAKAWYVFGPISLQPVELVKISTALMLANCVNSPNFDIKKISYLLYSFIIIGVPIVLLLLQPDAGTILVFGAFFIALYREGLSGWLFIIAFYFIIVLLLSIIIEPVFIIIGIILLVFIILFLLKRIISINFASILTIIAFLGVSIAISIGSHEIFLKLAKHQQERIMVLFEGEKKYRDTSGYNLLYSKTAIGSGGLLGKGYKEGTVTAGNFVPEQRTDYIFCTVGEEWGFVGSAILLTLYVLLIIRIYYVAEQQNDTFNRVFGYCLGSILLVHYVVNIAMVTGLFPTVGIPLPFFSYGGSSILAFSVFVFIFIRLNYSDKNSLL